MTESLSNFTIRQVENGWILSVNVQMGYMGREFVFSTLGDMANWLRARDPAPQPNAAETSGLGDLQSAFERIEHESKHYLCNGKGWLEGPSGEECGPCPDCSLEAREKNMPESIRATLRRGEQLMAMQPSDLSHCAADCTVCDNERLGIV